MKEKNIKSWQTVGKWLRTMQTPEESALHKSKSRNRALKNKKI